jgi:hypothetical protein
MYTYSLSELQLTINMHTGRLSIGSAASQDAAARWRDLIDLLLRTRSKFEKIDDVRVQFSRFGES